MTKAVFTTKVSPVYDDLPEHRYHFPRSYLRQVEQAVGDWIVYYEPRRATGDLSSTGGRQVYFATARVDRIIPHLVRADHYYAEVSNFLPFTRPVPFREGGNTYESRLEKPDGSTNKGAFGRAVRNIPDQEYDLIWRSGFGHVIGLDPRPRPEPDVPEDPWRPANKVTEERVPFQFDVPEEVDRRIVEQLISRPFRDRAFTAAVKSAYNDTCAMTGLKIINGGGRSEVQAAHIRPVEHRGPDSVRNGIALSGTVHWMFDRGLISIDDDYALLVAQDRLPNTATRLLNRDGKLRLPNRPDLLPHPKFLEYHRREVFKG
ncbi:HNH endonuclease [Sphingobium sp. B12D2B]|uniref:HNH endonuclease n=1 Tax=Sphingobium sp. B12D2B TaxID=2940577 RepID=UPI0022259D5E|nr:HNH endonuclease [Sphingobium sp. B12D2B]MCW2349171.1 putative restriction endonuclease [Sphingobium sp. B12D2B]